MHSKLYWIDTTASLKLAIMARPRAGDWLEDEIAHWKQSGIETAISLLEPAEVSELQLDAEAALCSGHDIEFISFPIPDRGLPPDTQAALRLALKVTSSGKATAIHCRAGIGRSSIMAAAVLIVAGAMPEEALHEIEKARGLPVPDTDAQRNWILQLDRS